MAVSKKLYRSRKDRKLAGVCAGFAEYLDVDTTWVRLFAVLLIALNIGILIYIGAWFVIPEAPIDDTPWQ